MSDLKIGTGATLCLGSDRYPYTVISISGSGKTIQIQADTIAAFISEHTALFTPNSNGTVLTVRMSKDGMWRVSATCGGMQSRPRVTIGERASYRDPSF